MGKFMESLPIIMPIVVMLVIGVLFKKYKVINSSGNETIKKLVVNLMLPAVLIKSFMTAEYNIDVLVIFGIMFALCTILLLLFRMLKKHPLLQFLMTGFEAGMLGYAMFSIIFSNIPNADISKFAVLDLGQVFFVFTVYSYFVSSNDTKSMKSAVIDMAKSPVMIAIVVGVFLGITGVLDSVAVVNNTLIKTLEFISLPTSVLVLIAVGFDLDFSRSVIKTASVYAFIRLAVMGLVGVGVYYFLGLVGINNSQFLYPIILMFMLPPPFVLPIMQNDERDQKLSATTISISTLIFLVGCIVMVVGLV